MVCILIRPPGDSEAHKSVRSSLLGLGRSEHGKSIVIIKDFLFISLLHCNYPLIIVKGRLCYQ